MSFFFDGFLVTSPAAVCWSDVNDGAPTFDFVLLIAKKATKKIIATNNTIIITLMTFK